MPDPLDDLTPVSFPDINSNSSITSTRQALSNLNKSWANDLDFVASQSVSPTDITVRLDRATSPQEFNAIKQEANFVLSATQSLQTSVNSKYQSEYNRLNTILTTSQSNTTNSGTTGYI